jgi:lipopolysaccharide transport system ATP-binding protein
MSEEVLIQVEGVSKKFCRDLKKSLWYGLQDITSELIGRNGNNDQLRPQEFWSLNNVSFELRRGECLGLIGPNGAGKSTLLKLLNGLIKPDNGKISIRGRVGALISLGAGFNPILTGRENIFVNGAILGLTKREINQKLDEIIDFSEIGDFIDTPVQSYSSGMQVRLGFAIAIQMDPDVLLIDEVLAVGDVGFRSKCYNAISNNAKNAAVIFVSHSMHQISRISTKALVLDMGKTKILSESVPSAIEKYLDLFNPEQGKIIETSTSFISNVRLMGQKKEDFYEIKFGDNLNFEFDTKIESIHKHLEVSLSIASQDLVPVLGCNSRIQKKPINYLGKPLHVKVTLPSINLTPGRYYLSVYIVDTKTQEIICWHYASIKLKISGDFYFGTLIQHKGDWEITEIEGDQINYGQ